MKAIAVITTIGSREEARHLARSVVERGLAACAQLSQLESFYLWEEALQQENEVRIVFKTTEERYQALESAIRELHPYELPAICAVAFDKLYEPYRQWIAENT